MGNRDSVDQYPLQIDRLSHDIEVWNNALIYKIERECEAMALESIHHPYKPDLEWLSFRL